MEPIASDTSALVAQASNGSGRKRGRPKKLTLNPLSTSEDFQFQGEIEAPPEYPEEQGVGGPKHFFIPERDKILLLQQIAVYKTDEQIAKWTEGRLQKPIKWQAVRYHRVHPNNQALIKRLREEYNSQLMSVEWSSKRRRLEELGRVYTLAITEKKYSPALTALSSMREEMEGKKAGSLSFHQYNYSTMSDEELDRKRLELVELIQKNKIIAAVSSEVAPDYEVKMNEEVNPEGESAP